MHKEREDGKGGLPEFLPWQPDKLVWLAAQQQLVHACSVCYVKQRHFWSWSGDREGVVVLPTADHTAWPGRGLSWWQMATDCCLLHGSFCQICLLALVGKPSVNPVLNPRCCKFAVAGPAQQKSNPLICWEIKRAAKFKSFMEDWVQHQELDWMILMHPFQPRIFCDPANLIH